MDLFQVPILTSLNILLATEIICIIFQVFSYSTFYEHMVTPIRSKFLVLFLGGAMAHGGAGYMAPGVTGAELPGGYHIGPVMPEYNVTVAGIDVL